MPTYEQNRNTLATAAKPLQFARGALIQNPGAVRLGFTLDTSDSMGRLLDAAAAGFNGFVEEQRKLGGAELTFNCFSSKIYPVFAGLELAKVQPITRDFLAEKGGATALLDGIGTVVKTIAGPFDEIRGAKPRVLIAILTDGMENASHKFSKADVFQMIHYRRTVHRWEFLFICADTAGERYGLLLGIQKANICRFNTSPEGIKLLLDRFSKSVSAYRLGDRNFAGYLTDKSR